MYPPCTSLGRIKCFWRFSRLIESVTYASSTPLLVRSPPPLPSIFLMDGHLTKTRGGKKGQIRPMIRFCVSFSGTGDNRNSRPELRNWRAPPREHDLIRVAQLGLQQDRGGLPECAEVVQDIACCGLDCGLKNSTNSVAIHISFPRNSEAAVWKTSTSSDLVRMYLQRSGERWPCGFLENVFFLAKIIPFKPTHQNFESEPSLYADLKPKWRFVCL